MISDQSVSQTPRGSGWLFCLLLATFVIGTDDFVIAGVLPAIAEDIEVSEAAAGQLVTVFSVAYAVAAPILAVATSTMQRRLLIVGGLSLFAVVNFVTAFAPSYALLMVLRVLAALIAASITPAVFAVAARLSPPERIGRAIGVVAAGLTVSLVVGVPIGSWLSTVFDWRATFLAVGGFTCLVVIFTAITLPKLSGAPELGVREQLRLLSRPAVLLCVVCTIIGASSGLMTYTYIAPITHDLTGSGGVYLAMFIAIVGVSGAVGTVLGGRLTDRWGADKALLVTFGGLLAATVALAVIGLVVRDSAPIWLVCAVLVLWGLAGWGFNPPMNARVMALAGEAATESVALNTSGLYVGIAIAGAVGGAALGAYDGIGVLIAATAIGLVTILVMAMSVRLHPSGRTAPAPEGVGAS